MSRRTDYYKFRKPDRKFRVVWYYAHGKNRNWIAWKLGMTWQTVNKYILEWENNHFGITKAELQCAIDNYDTWIDHE